MAVLTGPAAARRYLAWALAATLAAAALVIGVTVLVDPYRIFGTPPIPGWTERKPRATQQLLAAKAAMIGRARPRTLLLGSSRTEAGLDPRSPQWPAAATPVVNAGLPGHGLDSATGMLRAGIAGGRLQQVHVGLDFVDFLPRRGPPAPQPPGEGPREGPHPVWRGLRPWLEATLTLDALADSAATMLRQSPDAPDLTAEGFNPMRDYAADARVFGYRRLFERKEQLVDQQLRSLRPDGFADTGRGEFAHLRRLLAEAGAAGVRVTLFIHPFHANYLEALRRHGLWDSFEDWKRALAGLLAEAPAGTRLVDFAGHDAATTEPVPPLEAAGATMRYYWEVGHYTAALGERMIPALLGADRPGRPLTPESVEAALAAWRADRARFMAQGLGASR